MLKMIKSYDKDIQLYINNLAIDCYFLVTKRFLKNTKRISDWIYEKNKGDV